jgi:hypothetical protein
MDKLAKRLDVCANIAIILVAIAVAGLLITRVMRRTGADTASKVTGISTGAKVSLPNMDWSDNGNTLLFALAKGCHFCSESAPFYRRILKEVSSRNDLKVVAVVPGDENEGRTYLGELGLSIADVRKVSMEEIGVPGTPTLILVNSSGIAAAVWIGKLSPESEAEVFGKLKI